jgi:hypothetical protein
MSTRPNLYGHNIDQKTECEQGEDYEVGIDFHGRVCPLPARRVGLRRLATITPHLQFAYPGGSQVGPFLTLMRRVSFVCADPRRP